MDILDMGPAFRAAVGRLRAFAEDRAHWYYPWVQGLPGENPGYVLDAGTLRIVFTWTVIDHPETSGVFRHLSVSTRMGAPGSERLPNQIMTYTVAHLLGFTGARLSGDLAVSPGTTWQIEISGPEAAIPHVMVVERAPSEALLPSTTSN